jgi:hypothetical protein
MITGNLENIIQTTSFQTIDSMSQWGLKRTKPVNPNPLTPEITLKYLPANITLLIGRMYGNQCNFPDHKKHVLNNEHLTNQHKLPDLYQTLTTLQKDPSHPIATNHLKHIELAISSITRKTTF